MSRVTTAKSRSEAKYVTAKSKVWLLRLLIICINYLSGTCRICELHFPSERGFLLHMKDNHVQNEAPYVCKVCNYRSSYYGDTSKHFRYIFISLLCWFFICLINMKYGIYLRVGGTFYLKFGRKIYVQPMHSTLKRAVTMGMWLALWMSRDVCRICPYRVRFEKSSDSVLSVWWTRRNY